MSGLSYIKDSPVFMTFPTQHHYKQGFLFFCSGYIEQLLKLFLHPLGLLCIYLDVQQFFQALVTTFEALPFAHNLPLYLKYLCML